MQGIDLAMYGPIVGLSVMALGALFLFAALAKAKRAYNGQATQ